MPPACNTLVYENCELSGLEPVPTADWNWNCKNSGLAVVPGPSCEQFFINEPVAVLGLYPNDLLPKIRAVSRTQLDLTRLIRDAREELSQPELWCPEEGAIPFSPEVLAAAESFLRSLVQAAYSARRQLTVPKLHPGPEGSIDLLWEMDDREFLLNWPAIEGNPVSYFGRTSNGTQIKGDLDSVEKELLVPWISSPT